MLTPANTLRVFIVDDTAIYRKILTDTVGSIPGMEVAGTAPRGNLALQKLKTMEVDLVLMDIFMPEMDGLQTLKELRKIKPEQAVVMISGATTRDTHITIEALTAGASDFIPKPQGSSMQENMQYLRNELKRVARSLGRAYRDMFSSSKESLGQSTAKSSLSAGKPATPAPTVAKGIVPTKVDLVVIGVSTGGPKTLGQIFSKLPGNLSAPILIVQHMPPMFTASLADHLNRDSELNVSEAKEGEDILPGHVYIAPGGKHMTLERPQLGSRSVGTVGLNEQPPVNSCRPAVDVLFNSVAMRFTGSVLAIILTGMGEDGAKGVEMLKKKKTYCLSQSKETCVVYGMPQAIEKRGLADEVLPLDRFPARITEIVKRR